MALRMLQPQLEQWSTVIKQQRKENFGQMANGGGRDARRDRTGSQKKGPQKQDTRALRPTSNVRVTSLSLPPALTAARWLSDGPAGCVLHEMSLNEQAKLRFALLLLHHF